MGFFCGKVDSMSLKQKGFLGGLKDFLIFNYKKDENNILKGIFFNIY